VIDAEIRVFQQYLRIPSVQGTNREGQLRVDVTRSPRSDEWPLLREPNDWRRPEGVVQTATVTAASRRTIGAFWPEKIHAKPVADGSLALGQAKN
jgi:hypothetical protein